jgi:hypothetical protein
LTDASTRGGTRPTFSPKAIFVQMERNGMLGHRGPQPLDLLAGRLQFGGLGALARTARRRGGQRVQRTLLGRAADRVHRHPVDAVLVGRLALGRLPRSARRRTPGTSSTAPAAYACLSRSRGPAKSSGPAVVLPPAPTSSNGAIKLPAVDRSFGPELVH